ncbi:MAG: glycosyltransferase family 39 protein [Bacteroidales bacterium]
MSNSIGMHYFRSSPFRPVFLFLLMLTAIALLYDFHQILFMRPIGMHQWRSCISAAFPVNLACGGNFFTTQTNALLADHYTSDRTVVEFPLIYFIISIFYRLFGVHEAWFRGFQIAIGFMGLVYLFKVSYFFTRNWVYAAFIPLVMFTSPVYVFYVSGFIPDVVALSLTFGGFYYFLGYSKNRRPGTWLLSMFFFLLAGLTKTSSLLPFFGLAGVALLECLNRKREGESGSFIHLSTLTIISYLGVLLLISGWYFYAKIYSDLHGGSVSKVQIRPIWDLNLETIRLTLEGMKMWFGMSHYHARWFLYLSGLVFLFNLFFPGKANKFLYRLSILIFLGAVGFTLLFFLDMRNHDYYQANNFFIFVPVYLTFFSILEKLYPRLHHSVWTKFTLLFLVLFLIANCNKVMKFSYSERDYNFVGSSRALEMYDMEEYLDELGIDRSRKVHCTPDPSINISLYLCNRKGLTDYGPLDHLSMEERIPLMKETGIEYLILGSREAFRDENIDALLGEKIGQTGNTEIFRIEKVE